jgi:Ca2+-binding EF-hand superfamily protein
LPPHRALGVTVTKRQLPDILDTLDPAESGFVTYSPFLSYAALNLHHNDDEDEDHSEEVQDAYNLFTNNTSGPISLAHLRRVARLLKEEVSDDVLKDMLVEANGETRDGWKRGVGVEDFEGVMKRAGVFG